MQNIMLIAAVTFGSNVKRTKNLNFFWLQTNLYLFNLNYSKPFQLGIQWIMANQFLGENHCFSFIEPRMEFLPKKIKALYIAKLNRNSVIFYLCSVFILFSYGFTKEEYIFQWSCFVLKPTVRPTAMNN